MPLELTLRTLDRLRAQMARPSRITTRAGLLRLVNNAGFATFFSEMEVPILWDAIGLEETMEAAELLFRGAASLAAHKKLFYGKVVRSRATLVALDVFPSLLRSRWDKPPSRAYLREYRAGRLTATSRKVMDLLMKEGPMDLPTLRRFLAPEGRKAGREVEKALNALQRDFYLAIAGDETPKFGGAVATSLFAPVDQWAPKPLLDRAFAMTKQEAMRQVIVRFLDTAVISTPRDIARAFRWEERETVSVVEEIVDKGEIATGVRVKGLRGEYISLRKLLQSARKK